MKALRFSANASLDEGESEKAKKEIPGWVMAANLAFSLGFFIFLYKFVPLYLTTLLREVGSRRARTHAFNLVDGIIRMVIFVGFLC